jgi:hypothetical protein
MRIAVVVLGRFRRLFLGMSRNARPRKASPAQCAEVRRLSGLGLSLRSISREVFGHVRFRGRVERILKRPADPAERPEAVRARAAELRHFEQLDQAGQLRWLLERSLAIWAARDSGPPGRELLALLKAERQLRALEQLERLNARSRRRRSNEPT